MGDWTQDPPVITAIRDFEIAQARWRQVAPADGFLSTSANFAQRTAFAQMRSADRAYVWARDIAIHRVRLDFSYDEPQFRWPTEDKVNLAKQRRRTTDLGKKAPSTA
jgi:hypothetical protein